jgi:glycosyltransferase involved in cell wall biosynthesis
VALGEGSTMTRPPNVAIFASSFHPHLGGVEELTRQLAHQQRRAGGSPLVVTMRWPKSLPAVDEHEGIPVRRHLFRLPERGLRWQVAYAVDHARTERAIVRQLQERSVDIVHVQCVSGNGWYAQRAARRLGLPLVVTLQGELTMDADRVYETSTVLPRLLRELLRNADAVTACSGHTLREAEQFTGVELGERGHVIHNGVDVDEIRRAQPASRARPYILAIGRHVPQKGFDVLIDAYATVLRAMPDAPDLVIAGDGPQRPELEKQVADLGLAERIEFPGRCDRPTTASLFRGCELFVLPSRHEPQGIVCLEAMAAGKPVVATRVGGVPEVVLDGECGVLVDPGSSAALADALFAVSRSPSLRDQLCFASLERAEQFTWTSVADSYNAVYASGRG